MRQASTSQALVMDEAQLVDTSGYETKYRHSDEGKSLHLYLNDESDEEVDVVISRGRSRFSLYE